VIVCFCHHWLAISFAKEEERVLLSYEAF